MSELVYAIDFGTSNSLLAGAAGNELLPPVPLDDRATDPTVLKSILYTPHAGAWHYGAEAVDEYGEHAAEGRLFRSLKKYLPDTAFTNTVVHGRTYNLPELIAVFLREMRRRADDHLGRDVTRAVFGRPAVFSTVPAEDQLAEKRLRAGAELAGFKDIVFCPEPVAAAYEFRHMLTEMRTVLIADFGGGTSDFTVLRMGPQRFSEKDVLATHGVAIAGDRFDGAIMRHMLLPHFGSEVVYRLPLGSNDLRLPLHLLNRLSSPADIAFLSRRDILQLLRDAQRWALGGEAARRMERLFALIEEHLGYKLFRAIEQTKVQLSDTPSAAFRFTHPGLETIEEEIYSADFRAISHDLVTSITAALDETLLRAGVRAPEVDVVCLTGGTARLPALSHELGRRFGPEKLVQHRNFHSVIGGLAEKAQALLQED